MNERTGSDILIFKKTYYFLILSHGFEIDFYIYRCNI